MKKKLIIIATGVLISLQLNAQKVLFIGIDGVRSDALQQANTPHMDSLFANGTSTYDSWHMGITSSGPSWSDMLTGVWEAKHGITSNNYTGGQWTNYPYFLTRAKEYRPNLKGVQITRWAPMSDNVTNDGWDQKIVPPTDDACVQVAVAQLADPDLDVMFLHLDDVDASGHGNGFSPTITPYMNSIEYADSEVGMVLDALYARPNFANEDWIILLTTDHGGLGSSHGGQSDEERAIWWVAVGGGLPVQQIVGNDPGSFQFGTAPTANAIAATPVLTDIAVTALDHLLPNIDPEAEVAWDLDGKSWLPNNVGIDEELSPNMFTIFPNPNNGDFTITYMTENGFEGEFFITSVSGKLIQKGKLTADTKDIQMEEVPAGIYLFNIVTAEKMIQKRIVIR